MGKNVIVNGKKYMGISTTRLILADGGISLFRDADDVSSNNDIAAVAMGEFSVPAVPGAQNSSGLIEHGMPVKPDFAIAFPKYWQDANQANTQALAIAVTSQIAYASSGRLKWNEDATTGAVTAVQGYGGAVDSTKITDTTIEFVCSGNARFHYTYITESGETERQYYIWVAVKLKE
jgi:hypothetical protein